MNNRSTMQKKMGIIAVISAMLNGSLKMAPGQNPQSLAEKKAGLLTNYGRYPYPTNPMNQRQKRKLNRQTQNFK